MLGQPGTLSRTEDISLQSGRATDISLSWRVSLLFSFFLSLPSLPLLLLCKPWSLDPLPRKHTRNLTVPVTFRSGMEGSIGLPMSPLIPLVVDESYPWKNNTFSFPHYTVTLLFPFPGKRFKSTLCHSWCRGGTNSRAFIPNARAPGGTLLVLSTHHVNHTGARSEGPFIRV